MKQISNKYKYGGQIVERRIVSGTGDRLFSAYETD